MESLLVTGGAGFIGSAFVRHAARRWPQARIMVLDALTYAGNPANLPQELRLQERFEFWHGNVTNGQLVDTLVGRAQAVVHFAAESHVARSLFENRVFFETDVMGTQSVAASVLKHAASIERFVHISTSEVYGTAQGDLMHEDHPLEPLSPYAAAKCGADRLVSSYVASYDIPAVILRPFNNYGPYQHLEKVVPRFITSALLDEPLTVHGDGRAARDWVFVEDHCLAIEAALTAPVETVSGKVINIGSGRSISVGEIARMVLDATGKPESLLEQIGDRPGQVQRHTSSTDRARELLGWETTTPFAAGLERTIAWYADNRDWWESQRWMRAIPIRTATGRIEMH
jgi:dTDP-glucose 4,6-dehydratase